MNTKKSVIKKRENQMYFERSVPVNTSNSDVKLRQV